MTRPRNDRPRTIAIGDVHGCASALATLLEAIQPKRDDCIVTLGDYVDRGPDSRGVIDQLLALSGECRLVTLIGNHEVMMLEAFEEGGEAMRMWLECGGHETLLSYDGAPENIPEQHFAFLHALRRFYETERHIFVHANYHHGDAMEDQEEEFSLWVHLRHSQPSPHVSGKTVFVGHTPQRSGQILDLGHVVCIDTACAVGGWLTAVDVDTRQIWQADAQGNLRNG